jgi:hypothetical protein
MATGEAPGCPQDGQDAHQVGVQGRPIVAGATPPDTGIVLAAAGAAMAHMSEPTAARVMSRPLACLASLVIMPTSVLVGAIHMAR